MESTHWGAAREFDFRDEFAADSPLQQRVNKLSVPLTTPVVRSHDPFAVEQRVGRKGSDRQSVAADPGRHCCRQHTHGCDVQRSLATVVAGGLLLATLLTLFLVPTFYFAVEGLAERRARSAAARTAATSGD